MRPQGEIRQALREAAHELVQERRRGVPWRDMAARACVGFEAARHTIKNMARSGELVVKGEEHVDWSRRPVALYAPASLTPVEDSPVAQLAELLTLWSRA